MGSVRDMKLAETEKQRDAWRAACRYLYEAIGEGGSKGRPLDLITTGDYGRIIVLIGKAELLEKAAQNAENGSSVS